jgi:hypothetical protein
LEKACASAALSTTKVTQPDLGHHGRKPVTSGLATRVVNLGSSWKWVIILMLQLFHSYQKAVITHWILVMAAKRSSSSS